MLYKTTQEGTVSDEVILKQFGRPCENECCHGDKFPADLKNHAALIEHHFEHHSMIVPCSRCHRFLPATFLRAHERGLCDNKVAFFLMIHKTDGPLSAK